MVNPIVVRTIELNYLKYQVNKFDSECMDVWIIYSQNIFWVPFQGAQNSKFYGPDQKLLPARLGGVNVSKK